MATMLDRFALMRLFVRVAETGSLSATGHSLNLSQQMASRRLRELKEELGVQLVQRSTHELTLTEAGERFLAEARDMLASWETA